MIIQFISYLLLLLVPILIFSGQYKAIIFLALSSIIIDFDFSFFDFSLSILAYIFLIYTIFNLNLVLKTCQNFGGFLWIDFFFVSIVGIFFLVFMPWPDPYILERTITQRLPLRTLIGIFRTLELIFATYFFYFIVVKYKISEDYILKTSILLLSITFFVGLLDYLNFFPFSIRKILKPEHYALERFTGLTYEPRGIAQISTSFILLFIPFLKIKSGKMKKLLIFGVFICLLMIALSRSSTGSGYLLICLFAYMFIGKIKLKYIAISIFILSIFAVVLINDPEFVNQQTLKIARIALESQDSQLQGVPMFFNAFEGFDQSAMAFFYFNPQYLFFGVGPNTISIPSSAYMSDLIIKTLGTNINTSPVNGIVYILSRTGLVGIFIYFLSIGNYLRYLKFKNNYLYEILFLSFIYFLMYRIDTFFYIFAMIIAFNLNKLNK